jgi:hypothetical protein
VLLAFLFDTLEGPWWDGEWRRIRAGAAVRAIEAYQHAVRVRPAAQIIGPGSLIDKAGGDGQDASQEDTAAGRSPARQRHERFAHIDPQSGFRDDSIFQ